MIIRFGEYVTLSQEGVQTDLPWLDRNIRRNEFADTVRLAESHAKDPELLDLWHGGRGPFVNAPQDVTYEEYIALPRVVLTAHDALVGRGVDWLRRARRCPIVFAEIVTQVSMVPDVIGWRYGSRCILVECKTSRSDFKADAHKAHKRAGITPGHHRWYLTPRGLLKPAEIPSDWGLLEVQGNRVAVIVDAPLVESCFNTERAILASATQRLMGDRYDFDAKTAKFKRRP